MEILQFDGGRMKITLTKEELAVYEIDLESAKNDAGRVKEALETLLALAEEQTGTHTDRQAYYIQLFPSRDGGCELYVLKKAAATDARPRLPAPKRNYAGRYLCVFEDERRARAVNGGLKNAGEETALYKSAQTGKWYLLSNASDVSVALLEEFGKRTLFDPAPYLYEHLGAKRIE